MSSADSQNSAMESESSPTPRRALWKMVSRRRKGKRHHQRFMPRPRNPMPYIALAKLQMKEQRSLQSAPSGIVTPGSRVLVNTIRGRRARLVERCSDESLGTKNLGWVSLRLESGKPLLVQACEYEADPRHYVIRDTQTALEG